VLPACPPWASPLPVFDSTFGTSCRQPAYYNHSPARTQGKLWAHWEAVAAPWRGVSAAPARHAGRAHLRASNSGETLAFRLRATAGSLACRRQHHLLKLPRRLTRCPAAAPPPHPLNRRDQRDRLRDTALWAQAPRGDDRLAYQDGVRHVQAIGKSRPFVKRTMSSTVSCTIVGRLVSWPSR
jgi:hypothetical protein